MAEPEVHILHRIGTLHTFAGGPRRKEALLDTKPILNAAVAWDNNGKILAVGENEEILKKYRYADVAWHDAGGATVTPGLVDSHTHSVHAGSRANEFVMRCLGADYMEILASGGGILSSAEHTRRASQGELVETGRKALDLSLSFGVTTIEIKSGYGLDTESELKMLKAIRTLARTHPARVRATFCGAHAVPKEYKEKPNEYVDLIINLSLIHI